VKNGLPFALGNPISEKLAKLLPVICREKWELNQVFKIPEVHCSDVGLGGIVQVGTAVDDHSPILRESMKIAKVKDVLSNLLLWMQD
jgi:hypothetical protein